jgi:hypothetical protein
MTPDDLDKRLSHGWSVIDTALEERKFDEAQRLTDFWLDLLMQYQAVADDINYADPEQHAHQWRTAA